MNQNCLSQCCLSQLRRGKLGGRRRGKLILFPSRRLLFRVPGVHETIRATIYSSFRERDLFSPDVSTFLRRTESDNISALVIGFSVVNFPFTSRSARLAVEITRKTNSLVQLVRNRFNAQKRGRGQSSRSYTVENSVLVTGNKDARNANNNVNYFSLIPLACGSVLFWYLRDRLN